MVLIQHEHSFSLIDLNPLYPHDEQVYDDEEHLIIKQAFQSPCSRCHENITYYHRYYYKCDQCDYLLHESCAKLPTRLEHASHSAHTLTLFLNESKMKCYICESAPRFNHLCYGCSQCSFNICLDCGLDMVQYHSIYHPSHKHPLIPFYKHNEILAKCEACGKEHKGVFYHCVICFRFFVHKECIFQQKRLLIQDSTLDQFFHAHQLILTYSFPKAVQEARFFPTCRVCDTSFSGYENLWIYKFDKCRFYVHLHCVNLRRKPDNTGMAVSSNYYKDKPNVHLPLPDPTCIIIKNKFHKETNETNITHDSHEHPLILVDTRCNDVTTLVNKVEDSRNGRVRPIFMDITHDSHEIPLILGDTRCNDITTLVNKVEDSCNGCVRPIFVDMPFYKCTYGCNFFLHDLCTRLPAEFKDHRGTRRTLVLFPKEKYRSPGLFKCRECKKLRSGFAYSSADGGYSCMNLSCAAPMPEQITHPSHHHLLEKRWYRTRKNYCRMCLSTFTDFSYSCTFCEFHLHLGCAMLLPMTIRHKYDKHPMTLSFRPVENHDGDYFCEVCEEELNPHISFYHCYDCVQSMHTACAPLIIPHNIIQKIKTATPYFYLYVNVPTM